MLDGGKSLFLEVPDLDPAMTVHVYGQLKGANDQPFELNTFMTALYLQDDFIGFPGYEKKTAAEKMRELKLPVMITGLKDRKITQQVRDNSTLIHVDINDQLQFILDEKNKALLDGIKVGDSVTEGQTLLIVEAMKVMNPITAPADGTVKQIFVQNAQPVEFGEVLVVIE